MVPYAKNDWRTGFYWNRHLFYGNFNCHSTIPLKGGFFYANHKFMKLRNGNSCHNYILGGGISGLLFAFYNSNYSIISPEIGGKLSNESLSATILVHDSPETRKLLSDLNIPLKLKTHVIKYFVDDRLKDSVSKEDRVKIISKKMNTDGSNNSNHIKDQTLSCEDNYIPTLDINYRLLISQLQKRVNYIKDKAIRITQDEIVCEKLRYPYDQLISTISATVFWKLYRNEKIFESIPVTFVVSKTNPLSKFKEPWDLVYFGDKKVPYNRVNLMRDGLYLYEFTGELSKEQLGKLLPELNIISHYCDQNGIVKSDLNNISPPKIRFLGRFATWDHRIKIQDVIRQSITQYDFLSVWNKQKDFNLNFFDFNVQDVDKQQELTKDFALRMTDEIHELLSKINWKNGEYKNIKIDKSKILEEWIDIFKYWLGIGNVWGFNMDDFFGEFWRKTEIVDNRYKKTFNMKTGNTTHA